MTMHRFRPPAADRSWKSGVVVGIFEELGWTGFAVPRMTPPTVSSVRLIVGLLWGLWHLPVNYWGMNSSSGGLQLSVLPAFLFTKPSGQAGYPAHFGGCWSASQLIQIFESGATSAAWPRARSPKACSMVRSRV
jgi:hypothetical protein